MGQLVPSSGASTALAAYGGVNPWAEAARDVDTGAYLKFNGNTGDITFGSDDEELPVGSRIVVDMHGLQFGWTCWVESQVEEEILKLVTEGKPPFEHELKDHGPYDDPDDGWRESAAFPAVLLEYGEDANHETVGTKLLFKTSTGGAVRSVKKLSGAYGKLFTQHMGELPIVELQTESYIPKQKKHGKKWSLLFKIVGWISEDELAGLTLGADEDERDYAPEPTPAPARAARAAAADEEPAPRRRAAAPVEEPVEEPAPARRGRAAPPVDDEQEEAPAPARRGRAAAPADEEQEEAPAPARRGRAAAQVEEPEEEPAPTRRGRAAAADTAPADEDDGEVAPAPRGRSAGRAAPSARMRRFD